MPQPVNKWEAVDGTLHDSLELAEAHERRLEIYEWSRETFCREKWTADEIAEILIKNTRVHITVLERAPADVDRKDTK